MLDLISGVEKEARAKGPTNVNALEAFVLCKVARICLGKAEGRFDLAIECPGDEFDDILRLYTNGNGGNQLLKHLEELNDELPAEEVTAEEAKALGLASLDELNAKVVEIAGFILECREPVAKAMLAAARLYPRELKNGFPTVEHVLENASALLASA